MPLRVLLIDSEALSRRQVRQYLEVMPDVVIAGEVREHAEALHLAKTGADVALVEVSGGGEEERGLECIARLLKVAPGIVVMASGPDGSADLVIRAIRAGAVEFIRRPISRDDVVAAMEKIRRLRRSAPGGRSDLGLVSAVYATKGGLGVTTLATNLAVCLAQKAPEDVVLVDMDLRQGGVSTLLNLGPHYSVIDAFGQTERLDEAFLRGLLTKHSSGLHVLAAPTEIERSHFSPEQVREGLEVIRSHFAHVVLDLPHDVDPGTITALEEADEILYLVGLNVPAVRAAAAGLAAFRSLGIDQRKVKPVVMRASAQDEVNLKQAREALGMPVFWRIPNDYPTVVASANEGMPVVLSSPRGEIARNIRQLTESLVRDPKGGVDGKGRSPSLLRRVWRYTEERSRQGTRLATEGRNRVPGGSGMPYSDSLVTSNGMSDVPPQIF